MKTIKLTALAAAIAMGSAPAVFAEVDLFRTEEGSAVPVPSPERPAEDVVEVEETDQVRIYLHTAIEVEKMFYRDDPSDGGETIDEFDNEVEFGIGAEFDHNWEAYFELEIDNLSDTTNFRVGRSDRGSIEVTNAWVNYEEAAFDAQAGVFRPDLVGKSRMWFREHLVGARVNYEVSDGLGLELGTGVLDEQGDAFGQDRQITWLSAKAANLYSTFGMFQDGPQDPEDETVIDPAEGEFGDLYNLIVGWKGDFGPVSAHLEFNQNFGEAETGENYEGRAALAEFSTKIGQHKPRLLFAWGSGDDDAADNDVGEFQEARADLKLTKLMIDEGFIEEITTDGVGGVGEGKDSIGNVTLAQIGDTFKVNKIWRADFSATYLALSEDNANGDNYLGTEINWLNRWTLPTNRDVRLYLDMGYVFAGDAYGPDDVWLIEPGVRVEF